ncbi:hypothetical protein QJS10_CPA16g01749 [Acorus calamus]|uniref:Uncharacterized protein n=1 Tax=Acorus calamus TaxID=4465 RepID=A0AAV9D3U7_ACOCL|nr:hypothetical protein QJS10_CPA16g01749 [Acorus calamus]
MPKESRGHSTSNKRSRASIAPYPCNSTRHRSGSPFPHNPFSSSKNHHLEASESSEDIRRWEDARCPVCMEHPHNAVLLLCSSHDKGCYPFMCDTSHRHSNCLDQYRKAFSATQKDQDHQDPQFEEDLQQPKQLTCPLCRGHVTGWKVIESARRFMNAKNRTCSLETCCFSGSYSDLRKHARHVHPRVRPSDVDPERERDWRRLERDRDMGDLLSTIQSVFGEERERPEPLEEGIVLPINNGQVTFILLVRVVRSQRLERRRLGGGGGRTTRLPHWGELFQIDEEEQTNRDAEMDEFDELLASSHSETMATTTPAPPSDDRQSEASCDEN